MAPSRSTPQMMQVTRAAFQAVASLNEQATDPKSHTLVNKPLQDSFRSCYLLNSDGRPRCLCRKPTAPLALSSSVRRDLEHFARHRPLRRPSQPKQHWDFHQPERRL